MQPEQQSARQIESKCVSMLLMKCEQERERYCLDIGFRYNLVHVLVMCFVYIPLFTSDSLQAQTTTITKLEKRKKTKMQSLICACIVHNEAPSGVNEKRNHQTYLLTSLWAWNQARIGRCTLISQPEIPLAAN